jgi:hypothetical protein
MFSVCPFTCQALHYKEMEFTTSPMTAIEALIHINNQLRQPEAAVGVLTYAQVCAGMCSRCCVPPLSTSGTWADTLPI